MTTSLSSSSSSDWVLRSPLGITTISDDASHQQQHDDAIRPLLSALCVASRILQLSVETQFTAACLLHRYHAATCKQEQQQAMVDSQQQQQHLVLSAILFLACKSNEEHRRLRDVINIACMLECNNNDNVLLLWNTTPPALNDEYWSHKAKIVQTEQHVLRWLGFDCVVTRPHRAVVAIAQDKQFGERIILRAFIYLNDSIFGVRALQHGVLELACAAIDLALLDNNGKGDEKWWTGIVNDIHGARKDLLETQKSLAKRAKTAEQP